MRGGEKVLEVLAELYPDADLFTLVHRRGSVSPTIERLRIRTSFVQRLPFVERYYRHCLPLFPAAVEALDLDGYDLVVSSSHCAAKSVIRAGRARHLCYCLTPMRYAWDQYPAYFGAERIGRVPAGLLRPVLAGLARWDRATAGRVVAVGTTVVRALEGSSASGAGALRAGEGVTDLRIGPGFAPRVVTGLLTGIHEPGSSHFELLQAFAPAGLLDAAFRHAEAEGYLGHEFGDLSLVLAA